jgi:iron complex transport system ATP-binding protein
MAVASDEDEPEPSSPRNAEPLTLGAGDRAGKADRSRAAELLDQVECLHLAERPWAVLSQGERQRVLIARALMPRPRLLILDEPCAGLDPVARELFLGFVQRLATTEGAPSLVLVTHHVEEIIPCFTHALLLREGRVVASGPLGKALRSQSVSMAFGAPVRVVRRKERLGLVIG